MKTLPIVLLCLVLFAAVSTCRVPLTSSTGGGTPEVGQPDDEQDLGEVPYLTVGHGAILNAEGLEVIPDVPLIRRVQAHYIQALIEEAQEYPASSDDTPNIRPIAAEEAEAIRAFIRERVEDPVLADALMIDWIIERTEVSREAHIVALNNALRWHYIVEILEQEIALEDDRWSKGLDPETASELESNDIPATVLLKTEQGNPEYIEECREAGVPVPDAMFTDDWEFKGEVKGEFLLPDWKAELYYYESSDPLGVCLALPRYEPRGNNQGNQDQEVVYNNSASALGLICMGASSSKACYFDNPQGVRFERDTPVDIEDFVGGVDLSNGICTDCHAGENPFVVHPDKPPFQAIPPGKLIPKDWVEPLIKANWPQNPGPTNLLDGIPSTGQCTSCHMQGGIGGRFPDVNEVYPGITPPTRQLKDYCDTILKKAVQLSPEATMPPSNAMLSRSKFLKHISALRTACELPPFPDGDFVPANFPDDPSFVSRPTVVGPCYQCANLIAVRGAIENAEVEVFIDGVPVDTQIVRDPDNIEFDVPTLTKGEVITAIQRFQGTPSDPSDPVIVRDHKEDYPNGLPAPTIVTPIHECGNTIAVNNQVPGVRVTAYINGGDPKSRETSKISSYRLRLGTRPFDVGDTFTAKIELCEDSSPPSDPPTPAEKAPSTIGSPRLDPPQTHDDQDDLIIRDIVNGAKVRVVLPNSNLDFEFSSPWSLFKFDVTAPLGRPLQAGESPSLSQELCGIESPPWQSPPVAECESLPAPQIERPLSGDTYVVVKEHVPGARIRVYDRRGVELGDGSGTVIALRRALTGSDIITVVQQVGECTSRDGYRVEVLDVEALDFEPTDEG